MALSGNQYEGSLYTLNRVQTFIPEIWVSDIKRSRDQSFIFRDHIKIITEFNSFGDTIHMPTISRMAVYDKLPETPVTLQARNEGEYTMIVDKYKESSTGIEDIVGIQAKYALRTELTREIGYALARDIDNFVLGLRADINSFTSQVVWNTNTGASGGTPLAINRAAILAALQILQEADVPMEGIRLATSIGAYNDLLTIPEFSSADFVSGKPTESGVIGRLYGIPIVKSTQINVNSLTGYINGTGGIPQPTPGVLSSPYFPTQTFTSGASLTGLPTSSNSLPVVTSMLYHKDWAMLAMQKAPRIESSREVLLQADAMVSTQVYGAKVFRPDHCVLIHHAP